VGGGVAGYLVARRASRRRGGATVLLPSMLAAALVPAAMALLHDLPVVAALALLGGLATAGTQLGLFDELMKRVPREHGVTFSSVDQTLQNLGLIIAPSVGGLLAVTIGVRPGWRSLRRSRPSASGCSRSTGGPGGRRRLSGSWSGRERALRWARNPDRSVSTCLSRRHFGSEGPGAAQDRPGPETGRDGLDRDDRSVIPSSIRSRRQDFELGRPGMWLRMDFEKPPSTQMSWPVT
jgi:hypothetical protein